MNKIFLGIFKYCEHSEKLAAMNPFLNGIKALGFSSLSPSAYLYLTEGFNVLSLIRIKTKVGG